MIALPYPVLTAEEAAELAPSVKSCRPLLVAVTFAPDTKAPLGE